MGIQYHLNEIARLVGVEVGQCVANPSPTIQGQKKATEAIDSVLYTHIPVIEKIIKETHLEAKETERKHKETGHL